MSDPDKFSEYVREVIERWLAAEGGRTATALAELADTTPVTISKIRSRKRGVGPEVLPKLARALGSSIDDLYRGSEKFSQTGEVLWKPAPADSRVEYDQTPTPRFDNLPGWKEALAAARAAFPRYTDEQWAAAGRRSAEDFPPDGILDAELLLKLVENVLAIRGARRRTEAEIQAEIDAEGDQVSPPVKRK